jgi:hypothetical protein
MPESPASGYCPCRYQQDLPPDVIGATVGSVSNQSDVHDFLTSRRARITPRQVGLTAFGPHRRVAGLRREDVAMLAERHIPGARPRPDDVMLPVQRSGQDG